MPFRGRRHQLKLVERDLSHLVYCEDCDLYVEKLEFETHRNGSMHLGLLLLFGILWKFFVIWGVDYLKIIII